MNTNQSRDVKFRIICLFVVTFVFTSSARAANSCPTDGVIPDYNCDGQLQVAVLGDSLVSGVGDTVNNNRGGYVLRAGRALPTVQFVNLGRPGLRTEPLLRSLRTKLAGGRTNETKQAIFDADVVIFDLGRNDRWIDLPPSRSFQNIQLATQLIARRSNAERGRSPYVVRAVLMLPNRSAQGPWVTAFNSLLLKSSTDRAPSDLRFDLVSKRLLSDDQIHPTPAGYRALSQTLVRYLTRTAGPRMLSIRSEG